MNRYLILIAVALGCLKVGAQQSTTGKPYNSYSTNLMAVAFAPDFLVQECVASTSNVPVFQACTNLDATKYEFITVYVVGGGSAKAILPPANAYTNGVNFVTNLTRVDIDHDGQKWTNFWFYPVR